ncbi:MAG: DUF3119 family protein [cyanobacterium endosymbiont of Epithemia adnata isolate EadnSB Bon19]
MAAIVLIVVQPWVSLSLVFFDFYLLFETVSIRLQFTPIVLDIYH